LGKGGAYIKKKRFCNKNQKYHKNGINVLIVKLTTGIAAGHPVISTQYTTTWAAKIRLWPTRGSRMRVRAFVLDKRQMAKHSLPTDSTNARWSPLKAIRDQF